MGSADFWKRHFERHGVEHSDIEERFGRRLVRVRHPAGMLFEMVEADSCLTPWVTNEIGDDEAARGFFGAVMSVRSVEEQEQFLVEALGFRKLGVDGAYHRFETPAAVPGPSSISITSRHGRQARGRSAPAPITTSRSTSRPMTRSSPRKRSTRSWATPMRRRSRTATTSTRCTCDRREAFSSSAPRRRPEASIWMKPPRIWAAT